MDKEPQASTETDAASVPAHPDPAGWSLHLQGLISRIRSRHRADQSPSSAAPFGSHSPRSGAASPGYAAFSRLNGTDGAKPAKPANPAERQHSARSAELIDQLRELDELKCAISAAQARITVAFDLAQRHAQALGGVSAADRGRGVAAQIALARRESPSRGGRLLGLARALVTEMPRTPAALEAGRLNEWRATLLVRETACLTASDRCAVDDELAAESGAFDGAGDRAIIAAARAAAYRRDPRSVADRASRAAAERCVSLRPAPDTMAYLTALLPVAEGVSVYAALFRRADSERAAGDARSRGQLMADTLVEGITGVPGGVSGVEIQLVMTDRTLLQGDSEPAVLAGYGVVPAAWARSFVAAGGDGGRKAPDPDDGRPLEHRERVPGPPGFRRGTVFTSGYVVSPRRPGPVNSWPAMHGHASSHLSSAASSWRATSPAARPTATPLSATTTTYSPGVRVAGRASSTVPDSAKPANTKKGPGWSVRTRPGRRHTMVVETPTGHAYRSTAPLPPGAVARKPVKALSESEQRRARRRIKALRHDQRC